MPNVRAIFISVLITLTSQSCATIASISSYRSGSEDPLIYGGTQHWTEFGNGKSAGEGAGKSQLLMFIFPPLMLIPILDGLLSFVADTVLLPVTIPWSLLDGASNASVASQFDSALGDLRAKCENPKVSKSETCHHILRTPAADLFQTEEGQFAQSIVLPEAISIKKHLDAGTTPQEYFDKLCSNSAGEFIYNTVDNVEGVVELRPHFNPVHSEEHLYAAEDPYGMTANFSPSELFARPYDYSFIEVPLTTLKSLQIPHTISFYRDNVPVEGKNPGEDKYVRYALGYDGRYWTAIKKSYWPKPKSRYGYTWRGITPPKDRTLGIAGSELIVLDLETNQVLGVFRGFAKFGFTKGRTGNTGMAWTKRCPLPFHHGSTAERSFVSKVLRPKTSSKGTFFPPSTKESE